MGATAHAAVGGDVVVVGTLVVYEATDSLDINATAPAGCGSAFDCDAADSIGSVCLDRDAGVDH